MSDNKKRKYEASKYKKSNYYGQKSKKRFLEPGQRGFLATCNFREKDCIRECYNILNHYYDELFLKNADNISKAENTEKTESKEGQFQPSVEEDQATNQNDEYTDEAEAEDISKTLEKDMEAAKNERQVKARQFQVVDTGTTNCLFIATTLKDPTELGVSLVRDLAEKKIPRTRHLLRLIPIEMVCRANLACIINSAGILFDKYFLKEPKTFSIVFNRRYNNDIKRDDVIRELAEIVSQKNINNKVDLKTAEYSVIVEVIKGLCCLSVIPDYFKLKKYNLAELGAKQEEEIQKEEDVHLKQ